MQAADSCTRFSSVLHASILVLSPGSISSCSREQLNPARREVAYKLWEQGCILKLQKLVSLRYHLHVRLGNRMVIADLGLCQNLGSDSAQKMQFGCTAPNVVDYSGSRLRSGREVEAKL